MMIPLLLLMLYFESNSARAMMKYLSSSNGGLNFFVLLEPTPAWREVDKETGGLLGVRFRRLDDFGGRKEGDLIVGEGRRLTLEDRDFAWRSCGDNKETSLSFPREVPATFGGGSIPYFTNTHQSAAQMSGTWNMVSDKTGQIFITEGSNHYISALSPFDSLKVIAGDFSAGAPAAGASDGLGGVANFNSTTLAFSTQLQSWAKAEADRINKVKINL